MTRGVLDKLKRIKADLVRGQENWQDWDLPRLAQALKKWRNVNPATEDSTVPNKTIPPKQPNNKFRLYYADNKTQRHCVYCQDTSRVSWDSSRVSTVNARKRMLAQKRMPF